MRADIPGRLLALVEERVARRSAIPMPRCAYRRSA